MPIEIGQVEALYRYPVKSMRGEKLETAALGWHGVEGDRRFALRRMDERGGFPWLTGGRFPELLSFAPVGGEGGLPTHVRTPGGEELPILGEELAAEIGRRHGTPVEMMQLKHGVFDDASVSVIAASTVDEICRLAEQPSDVRRFRPNVLVRTTGAVPFEELEWIGAVLTFGRAGDAASVHVTLPDVRCSMVNIDPEGGAPAPSVLKACVRANDNLAGVYGTVTRAGRLAVGQPVLLHR